MKPSVVIVDDEHVICEGLARVLSENYITHQALSGQEAIDLVGNNSDIDVMLCDIKMPEMDGIEVIERIRSENKDIYVIVITAAPPQLVCNAMKMGANAFMCKPLDIHQLEKRIENAIKFKKMQAWFQVIRKLSPAVFSPSGTDSRKCCAFTRGAKTLRGGFVPIIHCVNIRQQGLV